MEFCRVRPINQSSEALREASEGAVEGPKRLEAVERLVEERVDGRRRRRLDPWSLQLSARSSVFPARPISLARRGIFVSFGNASGAVPAFPVLRLIGKSAFVCRPKLLDYTRDRAELDYRANQVRLRV